MKEWIVKYCEDDRKEKLVMIYADTYTKALLEFAVKYPYGHYIEIMEVFGNESKVAKIVGKSSIKRKGNNRKSERARD